MNSKVTYMIQILAANKTLFLFNIKQREVLQEEMARAQKALVNLE